MNKQDIVAWLCYHNKRHCLNYTIHDDLTVDINGDVDLVEATELPFKFGKITGFFDCFNYKLASLYNCPDYVGSYFECCSNNLTSLQYCPKYIGDDFHCYLSFAISAVSKITTVKELLDVQIIGNICMDIKLPTDPAYNILKKLGKIG
jgi:hypothetical protein